MPYVLVQKHKVRDYAEWKSHFDSDSGKRKNGGERAYQIFHTTDDPDNLVILFEWDTLEDFTKYVQSREFREAMQESGVLGQPDIQFLEETEKGTP